MNSSPPMSTFDQGPSQIPWTILKSNLSFQTTVIKVSEVAQFSLVSLTLLLKNCREIQILFFKGTV